MKKSTNAWLASAHPAQVSWVKAKALYETMRDAYRQKSKAGTATDKDCAGEMEALSLYKLATRSVLQTAREWHKKTKPDTDEATLDLLYCGDTWKYIADCGGVFTEPKILDLVMRTSLR